MRRLEAGLWAGLLAAGAVWLLSPTPGRAQAGVDYSDPANWLCRPGRADACSAPLASTVVAPDTGTLSRRAYAPDPDAPIDCFYVYPTVSQDPAANAGIAAGPEERRAAASQFARFGASCRTFAPLYRQTTVAAMRGQAEGADRGLAYRDVRDAWRSYLAHDNHGRGVVLIGHSQGASLLARLAAEEIDGRPGQRQLVSMILPGGRIQVAAGKDVGGAFQHIPLCHGPDQTGCVITYSAYLADHPPGPDAPFGRAQGPGLQAACVDPAALLGAAVLDSELPTVGETATRLGTPLVETPGLLSAACVRLGDHAYLAVSIRPEGVGAATLTRALHALDARAPGWGLHALDVNLALGDLVEIVGRQGRAWLARR
jgi:hypothetical protein